MASPSPKLFPVDPTMPVRESIDGRTLTNPTPEPGAQLAGVAVSYNSSPVIEVVSEILVQQAADGAYFENKVYSQVESFKAQAMVAEAVPMPESGSTPPEHQAKFQPTTLATIADTGDLPSVVAASTSVAKRDSFASGHVRNRSSISNHMRFCPSASVTTTCSSVIRPRSVLDEPLTLPPVLPHLPMSDSKPHAPRHGRSQSHTST